MPRGAATRYATYLRRRQQRLEAEDAQRSFHRQQRQHLARAAQSLQDGYAALSRAFIQQIAADESSPLGHFVQH